MDNHAGEDHHAAGNDAAFETEVSHTLHRVSAPEGFAQRVLALVAQQEVPARQRRVMRLPMHAPLWRLTAAAALVVGVTGSMYLWGERARAEREQTLLAQQHFNQALRLTGHALNQVAVQLQQQRVGGVSRLLAELPKENER